MKVGFVIGNMSHAGGTERVLSCIANGLARRGYSIVVISMWGERALIFPLDKGIRRYRLAREYPRGIRANVDNVIALCRIVKKENISVLVDVDLILKFYSLPVKAVMPGLHSISWEHFNFYYRFRKHNMIRRFAMWLSAKFSDVLLVLSQEDKAYYKENLKISGKLCQIYNPSPYEPVSHRSAPEKMVFAAGRLTKAKGFDYLLQSWEQLEKEFPDWKLCIAGEGEERAALIRFIEENGLQSVDLLGSVTGIEAFYEKCAFFVLPSRNEGFGMVLIEAMAYGNPVVSFACKAGPREIVKNGENGFLVPTGDFNEFACKMRCLMKSEELREKMGKHARESVKRFRVEKILDEWEQLLDMF